MKSKLTFNKCTGNWEEYLPLGNGRLGVMQKSHPVVETLQLNEEGIWSGGPTDRINPSTKKYLPQLRKLIKDGKADYDVRLDGYQDVDVDIVDEFKEVRFW